MMNWKRNESPSLVEMKLVAACATLVMSVSNKDKFYQLEMCVCELVVMADDLLKMCVSWLDTVQELKRIPQGVTS